MNIFFYIIFGISDTAYLVIAHCMYCYLMPHSYSIQHGTDGALKMQDMKLQDMKMTATSFFTPLESEAWSKLFLAIGREKEYSKLQLFKFWGSLK